MITPIKGQPIQFIPARDECNDDLAVPDCSKFNQDDDIYLQFDLTPCEEFIPCTTEIDPAELWGADIAVNGEFNPYDGGWELDGGFAFNYATEKICCNGTTGSAIQTIAVGIAATQWRIRFTVSGYGSGTCELYATDQDTSDIIDTFSGNGAKEYIITIDNPDLYNIMFLTADFEGCIDDFTLEPYLIHSGCFEFTNDWELGENGQYCHVPGYVGIVSYIPADLTPGKPYQVKIRLSQRSAGTIILTPDGSIVYATLEDDEQVYYFTAIVTTLEIYASSDYDGCIVDIEAVEINEMPRFETGQINLVNSDDEEFDLSGFVHYSKNKATLKFNANELVGNGLETGIGCFTIQYIDPCITDDVLPEVSNCIQISEEHECHKLMVGVCCCDAFGFDFTMFKLQHRVHFLSLNPTYPLKNEYGNNSAGHFKRTFGQWQKRYTGQVAEVGEITHDTIAKQLLCDYFAIGGTEYFFTQGEYAPLWPKDGRLSLATALIELELQNSISMNNNCCDTCDPGAITCDTIIYLNTKTGTAWCSIKYDDVDHDITTCIIPYADITQIEGYFNSLGIGLFVFAPTVDGYAITVTQEENGMHSLQSITILDDRDLPHTYYFTESDCNGFVMEAVIDMADQDEEFFQCSNTIYVASNFADVTLKIQMKDSWLNVDAATQIDWNNSGGSIAGATGIASGETISVLMPETYHALLTGTFGTKTSNELIVDNATIIAGALIFGAGDTSIPIVLTPYPGGVNIQTSGIGSDTAHAYTSNIVWKKIFDPSDCGVVDTTIATGVDNVNVTSNGVYAYFADDIILGGYLIFIKSL